MPVIGYDNEEIKSKRSLANNSHLAIIYPGMGDFLRTPVFFYLKQLLDIHKIDSLAYDFRYSEKNGFSSLAVEEKELIFSTDSQAIVKEVLDVMSGYRVLTFIGKSVGTKHLLTQIRRGNIPESAALVFMTPADSILKFYEEIKELPNRTILIYGTNDRFYTKECKGNILSTSSLRVIEMPGCGHGFEIQDSVDSSIDSLKFVLGILESTLLSSCSCESRI